MRTSTPEIILGGARIAVVAVALAAFWRISMRRSRADSRLWTVGTAQEFVSGRATTAAMLAARPHVHDQSAADGVLVVFDDEDRVAQVAHAHQRLDQAGVVALVQADLGSSRI